MSEIRFESVIPILRIFDLAKAKEFYVGFLGFTIDWEHRFEEDMPIYLKVSRGNLSFHLSEHHGDGTPGSIVYVTMTGIEEFHREVNARGYNYLRPGLEGTFHGTLGMTVTDPFGNQIRFNEPVSEAGSETQPV